MVTVYRPHPSLRREILNLSGLVALLYAYWPAFTLIATLPILDVLPAVAAIALIPVVLQPLTVIKTPMQKALMAFIIVGALSAILAGTPDHLVRKLTAPLVLTAIVMLPGRRSLETAALLLVASMTVLASISTTAYYLGNEIRLQGLGSLGSNQIAAMMILPIAFAITQLKSGKVLLLVPAAAIMIHAIALSGSRSVWLAMATVVGLVFLTSNYRTVLLTAVAVVLALIPIAANDYVTYRASQAIQKPIDDPQRKQIWGESLQSFTESPIVGTGIGNSPNTVGLAEPHNAYLQVLSEGGILLTIPFVLLVGTTAYTLRPRKHPSWTLSACRLGLIGLAIFYGFNTLDRSLWLALGFAARSGQNGTAD